MIVTIRVVKVKRVEVPSQIKTSGEFTKWYTEQHKLLKKES